MKTREPLRAWAWHLGLWLLAAIAIYCVIWIGVAAVHALGTPTGLTVMAGLVIATIATASWWQAGKTRP